MTPANFDSDSRSRHASTPGTVQPKNQRNRLLIATGLIATGLIAGFFFLLRDVSPTPSELANSTVGSKPPTATAHSNPAGYVGPERCAKCHSERVNEFRDSRHYLACVPVTRETVLPAFLSGDAGYSPRDSGVKFQMRKDGDRYVQIATRNSPFGVQQNVASISLMYGFGAGTDEVYFSWSEDSLSELPMSWLHPLQEWGTSSFDRSGSGDFSRPTTARCVECHNTWLEHLPGTLNTYRPESLIPGVTCEVCHGPASKHVQFHEEHPDEKQPAQIVRPARLSRQLQMELCAYCHSNSLKHRGPAFAYRPGLPLNDFYKTLVTRFPEDDHVANQVTYLQRSKCYQHSESMTCVTCHNPHVAPDAQSRGAGSSQCLTCHQPEHCGQRPELPEPVQGNCVGCHMPRRNKIQVNFDTANDPVFPAVPRWEHQIGIDLVARDETLLQWYQAQSGEVHLEQARRLSESLARTTELEGDQLVKEYRFLAAAEAYRRSVAFVASGDVQKKFKQVANKHVRVMQGFIQAEHELAERRINDGIKTLLQVLKDKPDHARAHGRLGTLYAMNGENDQALKHWAAVTGFDLDDAYGEGMIGWHWYLQNDPQKAVDALLRAEKIEPYSFRINFNLALSYLKLNQPAQAEARLKAAGRIEPQNMQCRKLLDSLSKTPGFGIQESP